MWWACDGMCGGHVMVCGGRVMVCVVGCRCDDDSGSGV